MAHTTITLVFRAAPQHGADPAAVEAIGRQIVSELINQHQRVTPVYDGTRGGSQYQWLVDAAQSLLPFATLALTVAQLLNEIRKLKREANHPASLPPIVVVVTYDNSTCTLPPDSDQALLERLLSEALPDPIDPDRLRIEVQIGAPSPPAPPWQEG